MQCGAFARAMIVAAAVALFASAASAQNPAEFYKGKNIDLYIGYSVGGAYDLYARLLARHMSKHIPGNPTVVTKNMEGAGSLRLANWLYRVAPKDGTVFGIIGRGTGFDPLLGNKAAQFDATKFKIVTGYPGGNEIGLAMERGEVQGRCGWSWSSVKSTHQQWYEQKKFNILVQLALAKHPD